MILGYTRLEELYALPRAQNEARALSGTTGSRLKPLDTSRTSPSLRARALLVKPSVSTVDIPNPDFRGSPNGQLVTILR